MASVLQKMQLIVAENTTDLSNLSAVEADTKGPFISYISNSTHEIIRFVLHIHRVRGEYCYARVLCNS